MNDPRTDDDPRNEECNMTMFEVAYMGFPHLCAFVLKDIHPGDELMYSYGDEYWVGGGTKERRRNEQHSTVIQELRTFVETKLRGESAANSILLDAGNT